MAGRGPAPKQPGTRARRNKSGADMRLVEFTPTAQPDLPTVQITEDGELVEFRWPAITQAWWKMWAESPLAAEFTDSDWSFLLDTAMLHAQFWRGNSSMAGELRLRVAKFGATPEDRLRLKIQFEVADEAETKGTQRRAASRPVQGGGDGKGDDGPDPREMLRAVE